MAWRMTKVIAGMDIGGTKTQVLVLRGDAVVADTTVPTSAWRTWDVRDDARNLADVLREIAGATPDSVGVGAHGCDSDEQCEALQRELDGALGVRVTVVNDAELLVPAAGFADGIGVVSGTGSIAVSRTADGRMLSAGGWGWILGDEGSAASLVREAAKAVRGAVDRERFDDPLIPALMAALDTTEVTKLGRLLNAVRGAAEWGLHANAVFDAAAHGSVLARGVIEDGGQALAELVGVLIARGADGRVVVAGGGVFVQQPLLFELFRNAVLRISPESQVALLTDQPVIGAVAIARRHARSLSAHAS